MKPDLDALFGCKDLRASPVIAVQTVMATRLATLYERAGRDPLPDMAVRLRSLRAAQALRALVGTISQLWPERFLARRPCCMVMSPDEALIGEVAAATLRGDRAGAMDAMRDLLPAIARERLFRDMVELVDAIRAAQATPDSAAARST